MYRERERDITINHTTSNLSHITAHIERITFHMSPTTCVTCVACRSTYTTCHVMCTISPM